MTSKVLLSIRIRRFSASSTAFKQTISPKGTKKSSHEWLTRQMKDPYLEKAKMENYRCRSAFKLLEMDDRLKILQPGKVVVDCGACPGSWTQVAVKRCNADAKDSSAPVGTVIALDILQIYPIPGATILSGMDITKPDAQKILLNALQDKRIDIFLSDMAPNATGIKNLDHDKIVEMAYHALRFSVQNSSVGGSFIVKLWSGSQNSVFQRDVERFFNVVRIIKPPASRMDSSELYIFGTDFKGLQI